MFAPAFVVRALGIAMLSSALSQPVACSRMPQDLDDQREPPGLRQDHGDVEGLQCVGIEDEGVRCHDSGGSWSHNLHACVCPEQEIFSARTGCRADGSEPLLCRRSGEEKWSSKKFYDLRGLGPAGRTFRHDSPIPAWSVLRGMPVEKACEGELIMIDYGMQTPIAVDRSLRAAHEGAASLMTLTIDPTVEAVPARPPQELVARCLAVGNLNSLQVGKDHDLALLCAGLGRAVEYLTSTGSADLVFSQKVKGRGFSRSELLVARLFDGPDMTTLRIVRSGGASWLRTLEILAPGGDELAVVLSPMGTIEGGRMTVTSANGPRCSALMTQVKIYLGRDLGLLSVPPQVRALGNRQSLTAGANLAISSQGHFLPLSTERRRLPRFGLIRAAVVEDSVDLSNQALASRLQLTRQAAEGFITNGILGESLFGSGRTTSQSAAEVVVQARDGDFDHGTFVAALVAADLPDIKVSLLPSRLIVERSPDEAAKQLEDMIEVQRPAVVNLSMNFSDDLENCDEVFGRVFRRFSESVLFVAGAANDGADTVRDVCPAGLAQKHPNVISVAGVDQDGLIHSESNYGAEYVTLAAPFCVPANIGEDGGNASAVCGTSIAAPLVTNEALRYILDHPGTSPADVKTALMRACVVTGIDVACGGHLITPYSGARGVTRD